MGAYFDLLQDKSGEPYFTATEKNQFLNAAQTDFLNELTGGNDPAKPSPLELDERSLRILQPLINPLTDTADTAGVLDLDSDFHALLSLGKGDNSEVRFVKYNDWNTIVNNGFTTPSAGARAIYNYDTSGIKVLPVTQSDWEGIYIQTPTAIDVATGTSDFPVGAHYSIVAKALVKAGVPTESEALLLMDEITD